MANGFQDQNRTRVECKLWQVQLLRLEQGYQNRTRVECKRIIRIRGRDATSDQNRTRVECKPRGNVSLLPHGVYQNRTRVECKRNTEEIRFLQNALESYQSGM